MDDEWGSEDFRFELVVLVIEQIPWTGADKFVETCDKIEKYIMGKKPPKAVPHASKK